MTEQLEPACWSWPVPDNPVRSEDGLRAWQNGRCGVCGRTNTGLPHVLDHDHATGLARGWLCWTDNAREGHPKNAEHPLFVNYRARHPAAILGIQSMWRPWRGYRKETP